MSETIHVSPTSSMPPRNPTGSVAKKFCSHCQRDKPSDDFYKPGTNEILKTCVGCRLGRAANRVRDGGKRRRTTGGTTESTRKLRRSTHQSPPTSAPPVSAPAPVPPTPSSPSPPTPNSDLEVFAESLGRLSRLLAHASETLTAERVSALTNEINHDWRVDEMATFVEGFLKGAAGGGEARGW